jgi:hypothetical protein
MMKHAHTRPSLEHKVDILEEGRAQFVQFLLHALSDCSLDSRLELCPSQDMQGPTIEVNDLTPFLDIK